jgi:hypothetical protein
VTRVSCPTNEFEVDLLPHDFGDGFIPFLSWDESFDDVIDVYDETNKNDVPLTSRVLREALERG